MMIEPPPARRIAGTAYFTDRNTPSRLIAVCRRQSANDISMALHRMPIPALAITTLSCPKRRSVASISPGQSLDTHILMQTDRLASSGDDLIHHRPSAGIVDVGDDAHQGENSCVAV